jgi:hypothetical protein
VERRLIRKLGLRATSVVCLFIGVPYDALEQEASLATQGLASRPRIARRRPRSNRSILAHAQRERTRLSPSGSEASGLLGGLGAQLLACGARPPGDRAASLGELA